MARRKRRERRKRKRRVPRVACCRRACAAVPWEEALASLREPGARIEGG
jgi:hypothetical protein